MPSKSRPSRGGSLDLEVCLAAVAAECEMKQQLTGWWLFALPALPDALHSGYLGLDKVHR